MGVGDDTALGGLPKHGLQPDHGRRLAGNDVEQHVSGPHRGKLVDVAHQNQPGFRWNSPEQAVHEGNVDHRRLVDNKELGFEFSGLISLKSAFFGAEFEQAVNGAGFAACGGFHALRGASGGRGKFHGDVFCVENRENAVKDGRFSGPGTAGDHEHFGADGGAHRLALLV